MAPREASRSKYCLDGGPAQQLSGERTHGFTHFSGPASMMLVGAGSVPACCQGNQTREGWCAGAVSQLRRSAWGEDS